MSYLTNHNTPEMSYVYFASRPVHVGGPVVNIRVIAKCTNERPLQYLHEFREQCRSRETRNSLSQHSRVERINLHRDDTCIVIFQFFLRKSFCL